jgi:hypothetical protein
MIPNPSGQFELDESSPTQKVTVTRPLAWLPRPAADRAGHFLVQRSITDSMQAVADVVRVYLPYGRAAASELDDSRALTPAPYPTHGSGPACIMSPQREV